MSFGRRHNDYPVLVFAVVALLVLGSLFAVAKIAGAESPIQGGTSVYSPSASVGIGGTTAPVKPLLASVPPPASVTADPSLPPPPVVDARAFAIIEASCGATIYSQNGRDRLPPASLTKINTAMVVTRQVRDLSTMVDVQVSGSEMARRGSSVMGIEPGMRLSVLDLLYGLFLSSGNDAALALAQHVGEGNVARFVQLMNDEARYLGMTDTHFSNPHGLDDAVLYSSVIDMASAGRIFLQNPFLSALSSTPQYQPAWDRGPLKNGNKLLKSYPGAYGVKIGFTDNAHQTIVAAAERDGRRIIVSVFGSNDRYGTSAALLDWAFANTTSRCPLG